MTIPWTIVGYFGLASNDVPEVKPAAVLDPHSVRVVACDVADGESDLVRLEYCTLEEFLQLVADGSGVGLPPVPWEPGKVILVTAGVAELLPVETAEVRLNDFVRSERGAGERAFRDGNRDAALEHFDRARRVSSEREDIEAAEALSRDSGPDS